MKNCVIIQLKKNEIWVKILDDSTEEEIEECMHKKMSDLKKLYKNEKIPIRVVGKVLKNREIERVQRIIRREIDVDVEFESPKMLGLSGIKKQFSREIESSETKFHRGSLRSGQRVEFEGSLVILGDVNGGAEVVASDNIVILGALRGLAHAGAKGNTKSIIASNMIDCPQIRISNIIKEMNKDDFDSIKNYAYINEDLNEIIVE